MVTTRCREMSHHQSVRDGDDPDNENVGEINQPVRQEAQNQALVTRQDLEMVVNQINQNIERTILAMA